MEEKKSSKKIVGILLVFFIGCLVMYGIIYYFPIVVTESVTKTEKAVTITENGIADAVDKVMDAVVVVSTYKGETYYAAGTGFVYQKDKNTYYVLTNNHVVSGGNKVTVTFTDDTILETKVVGSDEYSDIAVLSFETSKNISVASLGSSEASRVGDTVFAVGAPLDNAYSWTVTRGIVSGKDRMVEVTVGKSRVNNYVMKVLQTDAAINSGNSGGPLCNSNGEVIGINSLKLVSSGVEGIGFAIPIEDAIDKAKQIISGETVDYPYMGVTMVDFSTAYYSIQYYDLIKDSGLSSGVIIQTVEEGSAAEKAGIKENDIITKIDGNEVKNAAYLRYYLFQHKIKDSMKVTVYRDGKTIDINMILGSNKQATQLKSTN